MFKEFFRNKFTRLVIGVVVFTSGVTLQILDWGTGEGSRQGGPFFLPAIVLTGVGSYFLVNLKLNDRNASIVYAILFPIVIGWALTGYSLFYLEPRIDKEGETTTATITRVYEKSWGDMNRGRAVYYRYVVDDKVFLKSEFSDTLEVGDFFKVKYFKEDPNFHLCDINR